MSEVILLDIDVEAAARANFDYAGWDPHERARLVVEAGLGLPLTPPAPPDLSGDPVSERFEILGDLRPVIGGKAKYRRILIRRKSSSREAAHETRDQEDQ